MPTADVFSEVEGPLKGVTYYLRRITAEEELGRPFLFTVELFCEITDLDAYDHLGKSLTVSITMPDGEKRHFNGLISRFANVGHFGGYQVYHVLLRPWLWFLSHAADCWIIQTKSVPDILEAVFRDKNGFTDFRRSLKGDYGVRDYCVQYRETDFDFVSRLMEREGIYYYFEHTDKLHKLVLADSSNAHPAITSQNTLPFRRPGDAFTGEDHIAEWQRTQDVQTGSYALRAFDFEKPKVDLMVSEKTSKNYTMGSSQRYDYPGAYIEINPGKQYAKVRIEELQAQHARIVAKSNAYWLGTGKTFRLSEHPRKGENGDFLIVASKIVVESGERETFGDAENRFDIEFQAIPKAETYRTPRTTPKPIVQGPQTAIVVGKKGEEIWTDKYGRIKVQFHWDREGKKDENSSCWVRVAQIWAGKNWGAMHLPRIGQEVIVDFLEGDPDQPIITGRVYNADQMPPYDLPANQTQSGIKSRSTKEGTGDNFNELRFEDKKDAEEIYFHAEKDFKRVVENNDTLTVGVEKKDQGDQTITIHNNQTLTVGNSKAADGSQTIEIWKDCTETVKTGNRLIVVNKGNDTHHIETGNREVKIDKGNDTLTIKTGDQTITLSAGKSTTEAQVAIELKVGPSSIKIEPSGITIKAPKVTIQGDAKVDIKAPGTTMVSGDALLKLQGGIVKIN